MSDIVGRTARVVLFVCQTRGPLAGCTCASASCFVRGRCAPVAPPSRERDKRRRPLLGSHKRDPTVVDCLAGLEADGRRDFLLTHIAPCESNSCGCDARSRSRSSGGNNNGQSPSSNETTRTPTRTSASPDDRFSLQMARRRPEARDDYLVRDIDDFRLAQLAAARQF
jgi:hypothetical protein